MKPLTLGIALALTLAGAGFAQEDPAEKNQKQELLDRVAAQANRQIDPVIHYIGDSAMRRYSLSESAAEQLRTSLRDSVDTIRGEDKAEQRSWGERHHPLSIPLGRLLSYPACRSVLAEHLSAQQLQDFQDQIDARDRRDKEAMAAHLVSLLDYQLGLTPASVRNLSRRFSPTRNRKTGREPQGIFYGPTRTAPATTCGDFR
jgi:hypothetical protein